MQDVQGNWWIIDNPNDIQSGVLRFVDDQIYLKLHGFFQDEITKRSIKNTKFVHGLSSEGKKITLFECNFSSGYSSGNYYSETEFKVNHVFFGHHFFTEASILFNSLFLRFDFLENWMELNPFKTKWDDPDDRERFVIEYKNPELMKYDLEKYTIYFTFNLGYTSWLYKFEHIGVNARIEVDLKGWFNLETILDFVKHLKNFFSLAMGQNISVIEFNANTQYNENEIPEEYIKKGYLKNTTLITSKFSTRTTGQYQYAINIEYDWVKSDLGTTLDNWFRFVETHAPLYELFFQVFMNMRCILFPNFLR